MNAIETSEHLKKLIINAVAIGQTIKALGTVPSGHIYAHVMAKMSLGNYEACLELLIQQGLVKQHQSHLLEWIGGE